jgi:hypothetical protein
MFLRLARWWLRGWSFFGRTFFLTGFSEWEQRHGCSSLVRSPAAAPVSCDTRHARQSTIPAKSTGKTKVHRVMKEYKEGKLKSGSGRKPASRQQAVAIALSEARKSGANIPKKKAKS